MSVWIINEEQERTGINDINNCSLGHEHFQPDWDKVTQSGTKWCLEVALSIICRDSCWNGAVSKKFLICMRVICVTGIMLSWISFVSDHSIVYSFAHPSIHSFHSFCVKTVARMKDIFLFWFCNSIGKAEVAPLTATLWTLWLKTTKTSTKSWCR